MEHKDINLSLHDLPIEGTFHSLTNNTTPPKSFSMQDANFHTQQERYVYEKSVGEGAYGKVWRAKDQKIGRIVALKKFKTSGMEGAWLCQTEINKAGRLDHPGIPTIYDAGQKEGESYFTMKYVEGKTLKNIIANLIDKDAETHKRFPFIKRAEIIIQLLRTLCDLHANQVVHRDIKPDNILIDDNGHVYLMDWGIALDLKEGNGKGDLCGTPKYMSPEQCHQSEIDGRSDIYSLAATFYELLSLTYYGPTLKTAMAYVEQIPTWPPARIDHIQHPSNGSFVPSEFRAIIHRALEKDPNMRYANAKEMLHELEQIQDGEFCSICLRTSIKRNLYRYMHILDWNPYIVVPVTVGIILLVLIGSAFIGAMIAQTL